MSNRTLELIWQGAILPMERKQADRLMRVLKVLLPMHFVCLSAERGIDGLMILPDELELMPALPLGDVVVEELAVDVPYGSLLLVSEPDNAIRMSSPHAFSHDIGMAVGQTLLSVLRVGAFPLERENEALYIMACAFDQMARTAELRNLGLVPEEFSKGLAACLGDYWSGSRGKDCQAARLFATEDCLHGPQLRKYLTTLDPGFSAPMYHLVPTGLLNFSKDKLGFGDWLKKASAAVGSLMMPRQQRLIEG
ncbi:hypothetical protein GI582_17025 [Sulfitobacter sp. BDSS02]|uniref:hypothetical protein n=1 Tax=Heliomarina TaxID=2917553 RepID=UPI001EE18D6F|nr:hypothetical protein [Heliomarina baculiformis]MBL3704403.1 hypothetical protein [Sulfitobacter sp. BDSS02]MBR9849688.1 hypothetical protein [Paracoccaceae bacterium]